FLAAVSTSEASSKTYCILLSPQNDSKKMVLLSDSLNGLIPDCLITSAICFSSLSNSFFSIPIT
ncbi:hypothetical protein AB7315_22165, partial [Providencia manganoxydans]|uniref:hypothetical protein n=1 Tax=Providencia manganoxydans TaxID=2923283 RepID=UPI0034E49EAD